MADNYAAPSGSPDLPWLYRRSDDQPVGVVAPNGKEVLFGGSTDTVAREMATAAGRPKGAVSLDCPATFTTSIGVFKASTTWQNSIWVPCGVDAVQMGIWNDVSDVSTYTGVTASVQSSELSNMVMPTKGGASLPLSALTFGGSANPTFASGTPARPSVVMSDWASVEYQGPGPSYVIGRVWYPAGVANGGGYYQMQRVGSRSEKLAALGAPSQAYYAGSNTVGNSTGTMQVSNIAAHPMVLNVMTRNRVVRIVEVGDSTRQGFYSDGLVSASERYAISKSFSGRPTIALNFGRTDHTSAEYLQRLKDVISAGVVPDILVYQIATPNDGFASNAVWAAQIARAQEVVRIAASLRCVLVLTGPFPMTAGNPSAVHAAIYAQIDAFGRGMVSPGIIYASFDGLHDSVRGKWLAQYNYGGDGLHQNEAATTAVIVPSYTAALDSAVALI